MIPYDRFVSWEAFIEYVAANPGDLAHDHHWRSQFNQCRICDLDYDLITHLENSDDEVDFILETLKVENLTYVGSARDLETLIKAIIIRRIRFHNLILLSKSSAVFHIY